MIQELINLCTMRKKLPVKKNNDDLSSSVIRETVVTSSQVFSTADLWNIQRKRKPMMYRRWVL